jgi:hypothetical protein
MTTLRHETERLANKQSFIDLLDSWGLDYIHSIKDGYEMKYSHEGSGSGVFSVTISEDVDLSEIFDEFGRNNINWYKVVLDNGYRTESWGANRVIFN